FPYRFRSAELLHEINVRHALDALGEHLRSPAHGVQIHAAVLLARLHGLLTHAPFADHPAQPEVTDHLPLVRLFSDGGRRPGGDALPMALLIFDDHRPAVVKDTALKTHARG